MIRIAISANPIYACLYHRRLRYTWKKCLISVRFNIVKYSKSLIAFKYAWPNQILIIWSIILYAYFVLGILVNIVVIANGLENVTYFKDEKMSAKIWTMSRLNSRRSKQRRSIFEFQHELLDGAEWREKETEKNEPTHSCLFRTLVTCRGLTIIITFFTFQHIYIFLPCAGETMDWVGRQKRPWNVDTNSSASSAGTLMERSFE